MANDGERQIKRTIERGKVMRTRSGNYLKAIHTNVTVGLTSTEVIAANNGRKYLLLQNDSNEIIYIKLGVAAALNQGIRIPVDGSYEMKDGDGNIFLGTINAICTTGGKVLTVTEGL